jgi:hypothetical protein
MNSNETSTSSQASASPASADAISRRAYELWEQEGRPEGCDLRHWLQAEQQLSGSSSAAADSKPSNGNHAAATETAPVTARPANTDTRPLQGTRGGGATKRAVNPPPFERAPSSSGTTTTATTTNTKRR